MDLAMLIVMLFGICRALVQPKYSWPFGEDSFTYDVVHNQIGISPNFSDCFPVGTGHPNLGYSSFYLDRSNNQYVDVRIPDDSEISDFGLTMFINPMEASGYLFHFVSDDQTGTNSDIFQMYGRLINGNFKFSGISNNGYAVVLPGPGLGPYAVPLNVWTMISIGNTMSSDTSTLHINSINESINHGISVSVGLPGILRFGDAQPNRGSSPFKGFMTAAALYNTALDIGNIPELLQNARKSNWPSTPTFPPCPSRVQNNIVMKHLWPLDEKGLTVDVKTNTVDENSQCLRFGQNHSSLPNHAIHIDGSPLSYISLKINGSEIDETFTMTTNVFIMSESSGSFLKIIDTQDRVLFEVVISETNLEFNAFTNTNINCASLTLNGIFTTNTWYVVGIHRDVGANSIGIMINGNVNDTSDSCGIFGLSGELFVQIGDSNRQLPGYRSDVRCLIMFSDPGSDIMTAIQDECTAADSTLVGQVNNCTIETLRSRYHYLYKSDLVPPSSLSPLATYTSKHVTECAINCYGHLFCRSFTYLGNQCAVYDFVTAFGLTAATGAGYYVVDTRI